MTVDVMLRICSLVLVVLVGHQVLRRNNGGTWSHMIVGFVATVLGVAVGVLVSIRGAQATVTGPLYTIHLGAGYGLALSGIVTIISALATTAVPFNSQFGDFHKAAGKTTAGLLLAALLLGVASRLLH